MSQLAIFRNFEALSLLRSRYARQGEFEMWDANLTEDSIRPFKCPEIICDGVPETNVLYPLRDCECLGFMEEVPPVKGFCPQQHFHIMQGVLRQSTEEELCAGNVGCFAGSPPPQTTPLALTGNCDNEDCSTFGVAYLITYVTEHSGIEVESAPSEPSPVYNSSGDSPALNLSWGAAPTGYCITKVRLYRVEVKFEDARSEMPIIGGEWVSVAELPVGTTSYTDDNATADTGYPLTTHDPKPFPAPSGLIGLARTEDGIAVATNNRVFISVPGQPQFTVEGIVNIDDEIKAIVAVGNIIGVFTNHKLYKLKYRITEGLMSVQRETIHRKLPLKSLKSLSVYGTEAFFASEYSLYSWNLAGGYGADVKSELNQLLTPEQWKMTDPDTVVGVAHEYGYLLTSKALCHSIMFKFGDDGTDTRTQQSQMPISYIDADVMGLDEDGHIVYRQGDKTYRWDYREQVFCDRKAIQDSGAREMCTECCPYKVKFYYDSEGKNHFRVARIEWDERSDYSLDVTMREEHFGSVTYVENIKVLSSRGFNIPKFTSAQAHSMEIVGCAAITEIRFATSFADLVSRNQADRA